MDLASKHALSQSGRFSPLRYPGGKGKLARFIASLIKRNRLSDGLYVEPFAGGAAVAWELLLTGVVQRVVINDLSRPVFSFWYSVLNYTDELCKLIRETPVNLENRDRLKAVLSNQNQADDLELGFATFFLNRTHRSGILNGGVIGGRDQRGPWKMDARYNKAELINRIQKIAEARRRITLTNLDALDLLEQHSLQWPTKTLLYLDPPYYVKGRDLYYNYYKPQDHHNISRAVAKLTHINWIVSYDDVPPIRNLYTGSQMLSYTIGYSARRVSRGREIMFFSNNLQIPPVEGSMVEIQRTCSGKPRHLPGNVRQPSGEDTELKRVPANGS